MRKNTQPIFNSVIIQRCLAAGFYAWSLLASPQATFAQVADPIPFPLVPPTAAPQVFPRWPLHPHTPVTLVVLGDSIAFGEGASDTRLGFAFVLFEHIRAKRPGSSIINHAIPGAKIADVTRLELRDLPSHADVVILEIGANDVLHQRSAASVAQDMRGLLAAIKRQYPHTPLIICGIPDLSLSPSFTGAAHHDIAIASREDSAALHAVATETGTGFVDLYTLTQKAKKDPASFLSSDEFHPSDVGHAFIEQALEKEVKPLLW